MPTLSAKYIDNRNNMVGVAKALDVVRSNQGFCTSINGHGKKAIPESRIHLGTWNTEISTCEGINSGCAMI